jgi:hypothetical protein
MFVESSFFAALQNIYLGVLRALNKAGGSVLKTNNGLVHLAGILG